MVVEAARLHAGVLTVAATDHQSETRSGLYQRLRSPLNRRGERWSHAPAEGFIFLQVSEAAGGLS